jgi:hypothetical protein
MVIHFQKGRRRLYDIAQKVAGRAKDALRSASEPGSGANPKGMAADFKVEKVVIRVASYFLLVGHQ